MAYTETETKNQLTKALKDIDNLYKAKCVNWKGTLKDGKGYYTEIISEELLKEISAFSKINIVKRGKPYVRKEHCKISFDICESNRDEEIFAKRITGMEIEKIGLILDYQIPLKDTRASKGLGKIDLISFHKESNTLYLLELKYDGNEETLLRAVLEGYTYSKIIETADLVADLNAGLKFASRNIALSAISSNVNIEPAVLLTRDVMHFQELEDMKVNNRPYIQQLSHKLGVKFFSINFCTDEFIP